MTDTKELRRLALLATPGPWSAQAPDSEYHKHHWSVRCPSQSRHAISHELCRISSINCNELEDASYIAAASPSVVLALLDEIEELRKDAERYRWLRDFASVKTPHVLNPADQFRCFGAGLDGVIDAGLASPQPEKEQ